MNKEEKEAIDKIEYYNNLRAVDLSLYYLDMQIATKVALNLIKRQEKEIELLSKKLYLCTPEIPQNEHQEYVSYVDLLNKIIKQEKIIENAINEVEKIRQYFSEDVQVEFIRVLEILKDKDVKDW